MPLAAAAAVTAFVMAPGQHPTVPLKLAANSVPTPAHVVVVMEENHSYSDIMGNTTDAPYMNTLAGEGASMTSYYAITHPSDPNYLALFAGNTFGLTADECPLAEGNTANLGSELLAAGDTFKGYSEGLPKVGSATCTSGEYASKHSPWVNFSNIPSADQQPFTAFPSSSDYASLPTVSWVIPNLDDDMHDGTIKQADTWLKSNLSAYATWAQTHNSLLVVTWDEDDYTENNQVPTIVVGQGVKTGSYDETVNHYNLLATLEAMYGLPQAGSSAGLSPITDIWNGGGTGGANTVTVTNPGTRTATVGTPDSVQLNGTDSASGQTLTYSATGLPAGMSISSSGLISGTPTTPGTAGVVTATDTTGATGSAAFSFEVDPAGGADVVTVTDPGSQTGTVGTAASLQISGTDSAPGQSLAYSATGLPPGLAIGSASGLISGTPTTAGSYSVKVTADDTTGASGSTQFTWTVSAASGGGCTAQQLIVNPSFSTGALTPWTASSGVLNSNTSEQPAYTGDYDAWLDGYGSKHTDTLAQSIAVPSTCLTASLSTWVHIDTANTSGKAQDTLKIQLLNSGGTVLKTLDTLSNLNAAGGYSEYTFNVAPYIGQTVTLKFTGAESGNGQTSFVVGDNALNVD
ncbi:hypothetical protein GXW82_02560 [Streptacidiphilus sp. 4-A2]|nr:hypothetical protein [Streptacidiphilus sp. 4-A2]